MAREFGATDVVDASNVDPVLAVQELTGGGVDHAFEAIGLKLTAEQAFKMLGKGGTATVIGMVPVGQRLEIDATQLIAGKRLQGSNMGSNRFRFDMPQYVEWYLAGKLKLDELVSATMPLAKINDAFTALKSGEVGTPADTVRLKARRRDQSVSRRRPLAVPGVSLIGDDLEDDPTLGPDRVLVVGAHILP